MKISDLYYIISRTQSSNHTEVTLRVGTFEVSVQVIRQKIHAILVYTRNFFATRHLCGYDTRTWIEVVVNIAGCLDECLFRRPKNILAHLIA